MIRYALSLIWRRKLRTILTSLGITISVVLLSTILLGMQDLERAITRVVTNQFNPNDLYVSTAGELGAREVDTSQETTIINREIINNISNQSEVKNVDPIQNLLSLRFTLTNSDTVIDPVRGNGWNISGTDSFFTEFQGNTNAVKTKQGVYISQELADIYEDTSTNLLGKTIEIGFSQRSIQATPSQQSLNTSYEYIVQGIFESRDNIDIILPLTEAITILASQGGFDSSQEYIDQVGYNNLRIQAQENQVDKIKTYLEEEYTFASIITSDDILSLVSQILSGFRLGLIVFGSVSGVVAAIGIMNTMIMSVYEQTKEIGIIKSMGASRLQVLIVFLVQSGAIGFLGALMGLSVVLTGMYFSDPFIVDFLNNNDFDLDTFFRFDFGLVSAIIGGSIVVGILAGIYPALRAAQLNPVTALRSD